MSCPAYASVNFQMLYALMRMISTMRPMKSLSTVLSSILALTLRPTMPPKMPQTTIAASSTRSTPT